MSEQERRRAWWADLCNAYYEDTCAAGDAAMLVHPFAAAIFWLDARRATKPTPPPEIIPVQEVR